MVKLHANLPYWRHSMSTLDEELAELKRLRSKAVSREHIKLMDAEVDELKRSHATSRALRVGQRMPAFELKTRSGGTVSSQDLLAVGPVVVSFFRGSWCPFCNVELVALNSVSDKIKKLKASLIAISPERPDAVVEGASPPCDFPLLYDPGALVAAELGISHVVSPELMRIYRERGHDLNAVNSALNPDRLPFPATFVFDSSGIARLAFVDEDYTVRVAPAAIIETLDFIKDLLKSPFDPQ
jgi:peroxiredoxin